MFTWSDSRRSFLHSLAGVFVVGYHPRQIAMPSGARRIDQGGEPWLAGLHGTHRQFFDVGNTGEGKPLNRVANFLTAYTTAYKLDWSAVNALFGAHGAGLPIVCSDTLWERFKLGEMHGIQDPTSGKPATYNVFRTAVNQVAATGLHADATVAELMKRGVRFLACDNSIASLASLLAKKGFGTQAAIRDELVAGLIPGVMRVPAMLVAGNRAQEIGFTYAFLA